MWQSVTMDELLQLAEGRAKPYPTQLMICNLFDLTGLGILTCIRKEAA
jgi:hypothetical protein